MDFYIQFKDNYSYNGAMNIYKYETSEYEIFYYPNNQSIELVWYQLDSTFEYSGKFNQIPFQTEYLWEPWCFQQMTRYEFDLDLFREVLLEFQKQCDFVTMYIDTLPEI